MNIGELVSRNPVAETRADVRLDPYWQGLWDSSGQWSWSVRGQREAEVSAGLVPANAWPKLSDAGKARFDVCRGRRREHTRALLAAVNVWKTMTVEQAAAISGDKALLRPRSVDVAKLFNAELIHVGQHPQFPDRFPTLVRPSRDGDWDDLYNWLTFDEWIALTAGRKWRWGTQASRHNALAVEWALRVAEFLPVSLVAGEQLTALRDLAVPGVQVSATRSNLAADAMVVRDDGLMIMVEITASPSRFWFKAEQWAQLLESDHTGRMVVVFVCAGFPHQSAASSLSNLVRRDIAQVANSSRSRVRRNIPERMLVCEWQSWFPASHQVSDDFTSMRALRPTGDSTVRFRPADLLDPFDVPGPDDGGAQALVDNSHVLAGIPHWLRKPGPSPSEIWATQRGLEPYPRRVGVKPPPQVRARLKAEAELAEFGGPRPRRARIV